MKVFQCATVLLAAVACSFAATGPHFCPAIYNPVCGSDFQTYASPCMLNAAKSENENLHVLYYGECFDLKRSVPDNEYGCARAMTIGICTLEYAPICSSDGITSPNHCFFCRHYYSQMDNGVAIAIKHHGQCTLDDLCPVGSKSGRCNKMYAPVCSNGNTYPNLCVLCTKLYEKEAAGEHVSFSPPTAGVCKDHSVAKRAAPEITCKPTDQSGICTLEFNPVCGSNSVSEDITFSNPCEFCYYKHLMAQHGVVLEVKKFGTCKSVSKRSSDFCTPRYHSGICTLEYEPICGRDGVTYGNKCFFCFAQYQKEQNGGFLEVENFGDCNTRRKRSADFCTPGHHSGICTLEYNPVCGIDGVTYGNKCFFCYAQYQKEQNGEVLEVEKFGECHSVSKRDEEPHCLPHYNTGICTREYTPICGTDGKTHGNVCEYCFDKHEMEENGQKLNVAHYGECTEEEEEIQCPPYYKLGICTMEYEPICGSDGTTYGNVCGFCQARDDKILKGETLKVDHHGECH